MKTSILILIIFLLAIAAEAFEFGGYYRNQAAHGTFRSGKVVLADLNKLRFKIDHKLTDDLLLHLEPEYIKLIQSDTIPLAESNGLDKVLIDRAYFRYSFPAADLIVGRQRIAWGTGYVWNPTDIINPFVLTLAEEERNGVSAIRIEAPLGFAASLDAFYLLDDQRRGIRAKTNFKNYDLSISYMTLADGPQYGADFSGELFDLGIRGEAAYGRYGKASLGANYTFDNGLGVNFEYYYYGPGQNCKADYDWTNYLAGNITQLAKSYGYFSINRMINELASYRIGVIANLVDYSYIFYPGYSYSLSQDLDLALEALISQGDSGTENNPTVTRDPTGFLGLDLFFVKLRYSF
ncbi:hypothetical protein ACFL52_01970 [Candidatus Margulisiibacteriota bacterium]